MPKEEQDKIKYELPEDTGSKYKIVPGAPPIFHNRKCGDIDIRTLTPAKAQALIEAGCKHIVAKNPETASTAPKTATT
jgi:hypothetical protein